MKNEYKRTNYPSDLTDKQRKKIEHFFPSGNKSKYHKRNLVKAVMYIVKTGCQWRELSHDYPPYTRIQTGRNAEPIYALIDTQSVKTAYRSDKKGYDGGKRQKV